MIDILKVNIYIETDIGSRKRLYRGYGALVEFIRKNGEPETREVFGLCDGTWNFAYMLALTDALALLTKPCSVTMFAANKYVCENMCNGRPKEWQAAGWKTVRNEPIASAEEWKGLARVASGHELHFIKTCKSPYSEYLQKEIRKVKSKGENWQQMQIMS